jgi:hypothetical protein
MAKYIIIFQEKSRIKFSSIKKFIKDKYDLSIDTIYLKELKKIRPLEFMCISSLEEKYARYFISSFDDSQFLYWKLDYSGKLIETSSAETSYLIGRSICLGDIMKLMNMEYKNG